jgi:hypothetical protein
MPIPAAVIPAALGAAEAVAGLFKSGKTKREAARLEASRPELASSPFVKDQLSLAESSLASGMSAEAESAYTQGVERDLSTSLDAILKGGGDVNNVADIFDRSQTGRQRLSLMKENLRLNQIGQLAAARSASEDERLQQFQFNEWAPWADKARANAQARQGSENMIWGGLQTLGSAATSFLENQSAQSAFNQSMAGANNPAVSPNIRSTNVQGPVPTNSGNVMSPGQGRDFLNIDDLLFQ